MDEQELTHLEKLEYYHETISLIGIGAAEIAKDTPAYAAKRELTGTHAVTLLNLLNLGQAAAILQLSLTPLTFPEQLAFIDKTLEKDRSEQARKLSLLWAEFVLTIHDDGEPSEEREDGLADEHVIGIFEHFRQEGDVAAMTTLISRTGFKTFGPVFKHYDQNHDPITTSLLRARAFADLATISQP